MEVSEAVPGEDEAYVLSYSWLFAAEWVEFVPGRAMLSTLVLGSVVLLPPPTAWREAGFAITQLLQMHPENYKLPVVNHLAVYNVCLHSCIHADRRRGGAQRMGATFLCPVCPSATLILMKAALGHIHGPVAELI